MSKIRNGIYVLHCFEKESRKTDKRDIAAVSACLNRLRKKPFLTLTSTAEAKANIQHNNLSQR